MSHMQPQVVFGEWWMVDTDDGVVFIPADIVGDNPTPADFLNYINEDDPTTIDSYELMKGYGARLSAAGYLDCTLWFVFDTENQARQHLKEMYDVND